MSNFPNSFDDDTTLPFINDNITELGGDAINALRDAVFNLEQNIGLGANGTTPSIAARLGVSINPDGSIKASAIASMGLVTLPITQDQISVNANIPESKLLLDHRTNDLFNYIRDLSRDVNQALGWISTTGIQLAPHLLGAIYRHSMDQIDVSHDLIAFPYLLNKFRLLRDNFQSYNLVNDINNEFLAHQWADGSPFGVIKNVTTNNGSVYPSNYGHTASGIFLNTSRFSTVPQTANDLQQFADFVDGASILLLGTRIQNLYTNGISVSSRSSSLVTDGYGQSIIPVTAAVAFLKNTNISSSPVDDIAHGDDIVQFTPSSSVLASNSFDEQFALVKTGDIIRVNYGGVEVSFVIKEKKYIQSGGNKTFIVRINGKNLAYAPNAQARIDRPLFNRNKYGVLAISPVPVSGIANASPSLIVGSPRGAQTLGLGFNPDQFDSSHYLLYLALYPTGNPQDGYTILPPIDVTGNQAATPGSYTLDSVVNATNLAFRQPGYNYRFIAFQYQGNLGIMLADSYHNISFSILSMVVTPAGAPDSLGTATSFPNNVVGIFSTNNQTAPDPLGLGPLGSNAASPPFMNVYGSPQASQFPTKIFVPLKRNNYYVNGVELERMNIEVGQVLDTLGDGFWVATIDGYSPGAGVVQTTYRIPLDLSSSNLKIGKTLVVQSLGPGSSVDFGRFVISNVEFEDGPPSFTKITVYDSVHAAGISPTTTLAYSLPAANQVAIYFNSDSVSFNKENASDFTAIAPNPNFKRHFEIYVDQSTNTFTHERGRFNISSTNPLMIDGTVPLWNDTNLSLINLVSISPKLRGYQFGSVTKITLNMIAFSNVTGIFDGYLCSWDGVVGHPFTNVGPFTFGKIGEIVRFYDETNVDYIDFIFDLATPTASFNNKQLDIQLFSTLSLDDEEMLLSTCQVNDVNSLINYTVDRRQFGNTSEKDLSTSVLNLISLPQRLLNINGVVRGFDLEITNFPNPNSGQIYLTGGVALVNGRVIQINNETITIPIIKELYSTLSYNVNWVLCVNDQGDFQPIPLLDFDPILATPSAPQRIFNAFNVTNGQNYSLDASTFSDIINSRKDLTPLYIVAATVIPPAGITPASISLTMRDIRRFDNDSDSSIPAVLTTSNSQGNFRSLVAALNWLEFNSSFQNELQVKGNFIFSTDPGTLNIPLNIVGHGAVSAFTCLGSMNISNVTFNSMALTFASTTILSNVTFNNCVVIFVGTATLTNVNFNNSTITTNATETWTNVAINSSSININGLINASGSSMVNCAVQVTVTQAFGLGSNMRFDTCTFNSTANPIGVGSYNSADLVNATSGLMYANISTTFTGLLVRNCTFSNTVSDHFPFISIQLSNYAALVQNVVISGNRFVVIPPTIDLRAVIAFTSTLTTPTVGYPRFPKLANVVIENNQCTHDQMILISTLRTIGAAITGAMLAVTNCRISGNSCGSIGFITAGDTTRNNTTFGINGVDGTRDKGDHLVINNNSCRFIANLDSTGAYIPFRSTTFPTNNIDWVATATGGYSILSNTVNWIQVGCASYGAPNSDGAIISFNRVTPNDPAFLTNFTDTNNSGLAPGNVGILLRREFNAVSDTQSIISDNIINQKQVINQGGSTSNYYYDAAIACFNNAQIINNIVHGVINGPGTTIVYLWGQNNLSGPIINVTNNILERAGLPVFSYVYGAAPDSTNLVSITNNSFDSQFVDVASTLENTGINMSTKWSFHTNRNQVAYLAVSKAPYLVSITMTPPTGGDPGATYGENNDNNPSNPNPAIPSVYEGLTLTYNSGTYAASPHATARVRINLDSLLPKNVQILNLVVGLSIIDLSLLQYDQVNSAFTLEAKSNVDNGTPLQFPQSTSGNTSGLNGSLADVLANWLADELASASFLSATPSSIIGVDLQTATRYAVIDTSPAGVAPFYNTYTTNKITVTWTSKVFLSTVGPNHQGASPILYESPLIVRYRW